MVQLMGRAWFCGQKHQANVKFEEKSRNNNNQLGLCAGVSGQFLF